MTSNHLILCYPLLPPSIFPSIRIFSSKSVLRIRWPKYWSFSFSISPSNEYSGLISFRMDWLDLLAVQGTLKSLLQHHSSKHQFFSTQLSLWSNSHIHTWPLEYSGSMALTAPPSSFPSSWIHKASKALPLGSIFWPLNHEVLSCLRSDATYYFNSIQPKVTYLLLCSRQVKMTVTPSYPVGDLEGIQEFIRSLIVH